MSNYFANLSLWGARQKKVAEVLHGGVAGRQCFVSPAVNGWVTIYPADSEIDPDCLAEIAKIVCPPCKVPAVGLAVHGETMLTYGLFDRQGQLKQVFDLSAGETAADHKGIARLARPEASAADVAAIMQEPDAAGQLARLLGIVNVELSYSHIVEDEESTSDSFAPKERLLHVDTTAPADQEAPPTPQSLSAKLADPFLFPRCLHGDHRSVRSAWMKVTRKAWKDGNWDRALADIEFCSVHNMPGQIMTQEFRYGKSIEAHWRAYWIGELLNDIVCDAEGDKVDVIEHMDRLMMDGLHWFWFALGLLETNGDIFLQAWPRKRPLDDARRDIFSGFVSWLPEIVALSKRYNFDDSYRSWVSNILHSAPRECGFTSTSAFTSHHGGDIIQALLSTGAIEEDLVRRFRPSHSKP
jgi:hypothetical protein